MRAMRRILVAVSELQPARQGPLALAARLARGCGAELELFHSLSAPVIAARRGHHRFRALMGYTDWELLRASPVPVLLTRARRTARRHKVLAAVDPRHTHAKPAALDRQIVSLAATVAAALAAPVQLLHVVEPWFPTTPASVLRRDARAALRLLGESCGLPGARRHLVSGSAAVEIPNAARHLRASLLVMGDMSRRGLQRWFVGDTAERIVDELRCDVLIVKPPGFKSRIARRRRGMYVLANLPMA